jgi:hypothetical protein
VKGDQKVAQRIEKWLEEVFPADTRSLFSEYESLRPRELVIVAASVTDVALAELISKRLMDYPKEQKDFLGLDEDGRSPCASFGSRIQLALLLGIILVDDAETLRAIKALRNLYAHRVNVRLSEKDGLKCSLRLLEAYKRILIRMLPKREQEIENIDLEEIKRKMRESEETACLFLRTVLGMLQLYFRDIHGNMQRIEQVTGVKSMGRDRIG